MRFANHLIRNLFFDSALKVIESFRRQASEIFTQQQFNTREFFMKKYAAAILLALTFAPALALAQGPGRMAPPPPMHEHRDAPPDRDSVWISGYHRWNGNHYEWAPGHYEHAPRPHASWVPHRWVKIHGEWVLQEGHWR